MKKNYGQLFFEFTLIVVGVLFALMVDAWLESRRDDELRDEYLRRLADDIRYDIQNLDERIEFFTLVAEFGSQTLDWIESDDPPMPDVLSAAFFAAEVWPYEPISVTYEDLQSTGNIRLLEDIDVRMRLAAYHAAAKRRQNGWQLPEEYRAIVRGVIPVELQARIRASCPSISTDLDEQSTLRECHVVDVAHAEFAPPLLALRAVPGVAQVLRYRVSEVRTAVILYDTQKRIAEPVLRVIDGLAPED